MLITQQTVSEHPAHIYTTIYTLLTFHLFYTMNHRLYTGDEWKTRICMEEFISVAAAKSIAFGSTKSDDITVVRYYGAWQYLLDKGIPMSEEDSRYVDKLLCDGILFLD